MQTLESAIYTTDSSFLKEFMRALHYTLEQFHTVTNLYTFQDDILLKNSLETSSHFDVLFLDIDAFHTCMQIAEFSNKLPVSPFLIFVSSSGKITPGMLHLLPFYIIRKNFLYKELHESLSSLLRDIPDTVRRPYVTLSSGNSLYRFDLNQIRYLESMNKELHIVLQNSSCTLRYSINQAEELLKHHQFLRTHKSFLVNANCIFRIDSSQVILDDGCSLPLSRYRVQKVKEQFQEIFQWNIL